MAGSGFVLLYFTFTPTHQIPICKARTMYEWKSAPVFQVARSIARSSLTNLNNDTLKSTDLLYNRLNYLVRKLRRLTVDKL